MLASAARESGLVAVRAFSTSAALQAAPALATAKRSFLAQLFGSGSRVDVPLTDVLPGVELPQPIAHSKEAPATQLTKLSNGCTVATENTPVSPPLALAWPVKLHTCSSSCDASLQLRQAKGWPPTLPPPCRAPPPPSASTSIAAACMRLPPTPVGAECRGQAARECCCI